MPYTSIHTNIHNPKYCLDVAAGSKKNRAALISYPCHNGTNQKFSYRKKTKQIVAKHSKKCLEVVKNSVIQNKCKTRKNSQKWTYNPKNKHIKSLKNKKCLDVSGLRYNQGQLITYPCHNGPNQKFV